MAERAKESGEVVRTTMSSDLSSKGSDSTASALSRSPLMKVPLDDFTSLMKIYRARFTLEPLQKVPETHLSAFLPYFCVLS